METMEFIKNNASIIGECGEAEDVDLYRYYLCGETLYFEGAGELIDGYDFYDFDWSPSYDRVFKLNSAKKIIISSGCTAIGDNVFDEVRDWTCGENWDRIYIKEPFHAESIIIPYGVTAIGERAFAGCVYLHTLVIPETVVSIGKDAFLGVPHIVYHGLAQSDDNWGAKKRN